MHCKKGIGTPVAFFFHNSLNVLKCIEIRTSPFVNSISYISQTPDAFLLCPPVALFSSSTMDDDQHSALSDTTCTTKKTEDKPSHDASIFVGRSVCSSLKL